jgi:extracellular elastinolytic metalloproteinase
LLYSPRAGTNAPSHPAGTLVPGRWRAPGDAFPSVRPRPRAPELIIRSFDVPKTQATHVRLVVLSSQCTGFAGYAGEQDNDPRANTDCATAAAAAASQTVHVAEFQVFSK